MRKLAFDSDRNPVASITSHADLGAEPHRARAGSWALILVLGLLSSVSVRAEFVVVEAAAKPGQEWRPMLTQTLDTVPGAGKLPADAGLSIYGGLRGSKEKATGFFHTANINGRWWLVDPDGCLYLNKGVNSVATIPTPGAQAALEKVFGSPENWVRDTTKTMRNLGYNGAGAWSDTTALRTVSEPLAYTRIWNFMSAYGGRRGGTYQQAGHIGYPKDCIFVFDPAFEKFCDEYAQQLAAQKDDPWLLGHFSDNEMPLRRYVLANYLSLPADDPGHQAALKWLRERHGPAAGIKDITEKDKQDFLGVVVDRYFRIVSQAIKKYDPNHLILGCRFNGQALRCPEVFKAAGLYADVISVNYYRVWTPGQSDLAGWARDAGKPVLITEWYAKGADSGLPNTSGSGWLVKTQHDRGLFYENFTLGLLESKACVGWHWFRYADNDPEDKTVDPSNIDSNKGIVNNRYVPYQPLMDSMKRINQRVYGLISYFDEKTEKEQRAAEAETKSK
jgi:hypothetical protein